MRSILPAPAEISPPALPANMPGPQPETAPQTAEQPVHVLWLPLIALITGFSLVKIGVPLLAAIGIVAVATTIGIVRRLNAAS